MILSKNSEQHTISFILLASVSKIPSYKNAHNPLEIIFSEHATYNLLIRMTKYVFYTNMLRELLLWRGKNQVKTHFSFREAKMFLLSIFKIRNREYCLVINKCNDTDIREETKNENEGKEKEEKEKKKNIFTEIEKLAS